MISCGGFLVGFQEDLHQQAVHGSVIQHDLCRLYSEFV